MKNKPMRCRRVRADLLRAVDGGLELEERFALDSHLESCPECRALHEGLALAEEGSARLSAQAALAGERLDLDGALARLDSVLREKSLEASSTPIQSANPFAREAFGRRRAAIWASVAAVLFSVIGWQVFGPERNPSKDGIRSIGDNSVAVVHIADVHVADVHIADVHSGLSTAQVEDEAVALSDAELEQIARDAASQRLAQACLLEFAVADNFVVDESEAADRVESSLADLCASGWPLTRLAEGLVHDDDSEIAAAVVRYLGARGDGVTAVRLGSLIRDERVGLAAVDALGQLAARGLSGGVNGLRRALDVPERAARAIEHLGRTPSTQSAQALADALRSSRIQRQLPARFGGQDPARQALLEALIEVGAPAVGSLYALAEDAARNSLTGLGSTLEAGDLIAQIAGLRGHGPELARILERDLGSSLAFSAVRSSGDAALLPWIEARASSTRSSAEGLAVLSGMPGQGVAGVLARLARRDRIPGGRMEQTLARVLQLDSERIGRWIEERDLQLRGRSGADGREERFELEAFGQLLLATTSRYGGPALLALTLAESLPDDERVWAALALADAGDEEAIFGLAEALEADVKGTATLAQSAPRLLAAQLLAVRRVLGQAAVRPCLAASGVVDIDAALGVIEHESERGALAVGLHRVARTLDDRRGAGLAQLHRRNSQ